MKKNVLLSVLVLMSFGCLLNPLQDPRSSVKTNEDGRKIVADTEPGWEWWKEDTENIIATQKRGEPILDGGGPGSRCDYEGFWRRQKKALQQYQENPQKYINYIDRRLKEEGF